MRLVQIKLHHSHPFWFLDDQIRLDGKHPISDFVNIDSLDEEHRKIIDASAKAFKIQLFDVEGNRVKDLTELSIIECDFEVSTEDVDEVEPNFPEMVSVTVPEEESEEEEEETPDYSEEAKILLSQNGHTVKKAIANLPKEDASLYMLHNMLKIEENDKGRKGVIGAIETAIGGY